VPEELLHGSVGGRIDPWCPFCIQAMQTKLGHPKLSHAVQVTSGNLFLGRPVPVRYEREGVGVQSVRRGPVRRRDHQVAPFAADRARVYRRPRRRASLFVVGPREQVLVAFLRAGGID